MFEALALRLIHYFIALGVFFKRWITYFPILGLAYKQKTGVGTVTSDARNLKKLPLHLGILILEDEFCYADITNIIVWAIALGISYISIYDMNGILKRNVSSLKKELDKSRENILDVENNKYNVHIHADASDQNFSSEGCKTTSRIDIQLLSEENGRKDLVETARLLSRQVANKQYRLQDIHPQNIDTLIQEKYVFPDPDLILKFGEVESLFGFMPWQIRLTEILSLPSHKGFNYKSFLSVLHTYGNTQQRHGR